DAACSQCSFAVAFLFMYVFVWHCGFFFSSRRRHTRFSRDWSSDVCSSDLQPAASTASNRSTTDTRRCPDNGPAAPPPPARSTTRSEERRVGKECSARWGPHH